MKTGPGACCFDASFPPVGLSGCTDEVPGCPRAPRRESKLRAEEVLLSLSNSQTGRVLWLHEKRHAPDMKAVSEQWVGCQVGADLRHAVGKGLARPALYQHFAWMGEEAAG